MRKGLRKDGIWGKGRDIWSYIYTKHGNSVLVGRLGDLEERSILDSEKSLRKGLGHIL